jgi:hypothetical protein
MMAIDIYPWLVKTSYVTDSLTSTLDRKDSLAMTEILLLLFTFFHSTLKERRDLALENLALR